MRYVSRYLKYLSYINFRVHDSMFMYVIAKYKQAMKIMKSFLINKSIKYK